jgi:hypothetical protein
MNLTVVICHYKENLDWVERLVHNHVVYNKNQEKRDYFKYNLDNYGFDTIAYITYVVDNYDSLPDYICFSQDNPFYHCGNFLEKVNNFDFKTEYLPLGATYFRDNAQIIDKSINYAKEIGLEITLPIKFINSAQCIVSKNLILKNDLELYKKILNSYHKNKVITDLNYTIEYLWPSIFHFNNELNISLTNCQ